MPVYDALYDYHEQIKHVLTRHEQGAIHAAQGYARVSGKVGVCLATSGPGATNLITGLADAQIDSTPLVCITGQVAAHLLGTDAFQETDVVGISMPGTKWNIQVRRVEDIAPAIAKGFYIARSGRPGPVLIDITKNAQVDFGEFNYVPCQGFRSYKTHHPIEKTAIQQAAELINQAERPYLLFGQGVVLGNAESTEVANLHAGWRGLANGIIENTVAEMKSQPTWAWLGAAISQACFEVGAEVRAVFCDKYPELASAFIAGQVEGKYQADLYAIARFILNHLGVETVLGGDQCSYQQAEDYFSYRRDAKTGRMATFVFMQ